MATKFKVFVMDAKTSKDPESSIISGVVNVEAKDLDSAMVAAVKQFREKKSETEKTDNKEEA